MKNQRQIILIAFSIFYLLSEFTNIIYFSILTAICLLIIIVQNMPLVGKTNQKISLVLFFFGIMFLIKTNSSIGEWITAISSNSGLVVLFIVLPFLSFPLYFEDYEKSLRQFSLKHINNVIQFGNLSGFLTYFLSALLNVGSFPIVYNLFDKTVDFTDKDRTLWLSMMRGNTAAIFWSPNFVAVAVILHYLELPWLTILPMGFLLSLITMFSNWVTMYVRAKLNEEQYERKEIPYDLTPEDNKKLFKLTRTFLILILLIGFFNIFTTLKLLVIVPIVALIYPLLLAILQKSFSSYIKQLKNYYTKSLLNIKNEIIIFAAAGFFGKSLEISGVGEIIPSLIKLDSIHQPFLVILAIIILMGALSIIGIHPIVTSTALATTIGAETLGISVYAYAFTLLASYGLSVLISPFSGMNLVMSGLTKHSSWELGPRLNIIYCLGMGIIFAIIIPFIK
ncbi:hypothetical protein SAMN00017405_2171 [Desulfonispora thiosulfatigenes DSM 11270]|uniref:Di-and tricarboxylate transporter n=1 Tax=Desulfonispora thiosulfatigenes DSM 11270 TaxID=656914 RepID=A0A1W1UKY5_DESTI|nr:hypothetical protein [Desulfonispora thiosulfatigenes]SMB81756.1 hypothetical protein SAMN00017405_2171 [Desulfonispora thiosulfatigenes DSM 11270]